MAGHRGRFGAPGRSVLVAVQRRVGVEPRPRPDRPRSALMPHTRSANIALPPMSGCPEASRPRPPTATTRSRAGSCPGLEPPRRRDRHRVRRRRVARRPQPHRNVAGQADCGPDPSSAPRACSSTPPSADARSRPQLKVTCRPVTFAFRADAGAGGPDRRDVGRVDGLGRRGRSAGQEVPSPGKHGGDLVGAGGERGDRPARRRAADERTGPPSGWPSARNWTVPVGVPPRSPKSSPSP